MRAFQALPSAVSNTSFTEEDGAAGDLRIEAVSIAPRRTRSRMREVQYAPFGLSFLK